MSDHDCARDHPNRSHLEAENKRLREELALRDDSLANRRVRELRAEIEGGWLALGLRRNPQHDVFIADGINRLRAMHAERLGTDDDERQAVLDCINLYGDETLHKALDGIGWPQAYVQREGAR